MRRTVKEEAAVEHAGTDARDGAPGDAGGEAAGGGADATGDARQQAAGARARAAGDAREDDTLAAIESQSRRLRNSIVSLAVFFVLLVGLLAGVPGLRSAAERITDAKPAWVVAGVACEVLSCVGYMVLFDLVFSKIGRRLGSRLSLVEAGMNLAGSGSGRAGL